jgi:negative regulator of genetic competence, sporulation and motility
MQANYEVSVCSVQDDVPAYITVEFEKYDDAVEFANRYEPKGFTPAIHNLANDFYLMIGGHIT